MSLQDLHNNLMLNSINDHIQEHTKEKYPKGEQFIGASSNENQPGELKQICKCVSQGIFCGNTDNQRDARRVQFFGTAIDSYNSALKPLPRLPNLLYCKA